MVVPSPPRVFAPRTLVSSEGGRALYCERPVREEVRRRFRAEGGLERGRLREPEGHREAGQRSPAGIRDHGEKGPASGLPLGPRDYFPAFERSRPDRRYPSVAADGQV